MTTATLEAPGSAGRGFEPLDHETPTADLEALHGLARAVSARQHARSGLPTEAVEVGSWAGRTALVLEGTFDRVYCVDHWCGNPGDRLGALATRYGAERVFRTFCANMGDRLFRTVFPCLGTSRQWAAVWPRPVDLVFIDGSHDYDSVVADIGAWSPHVAPGGMIVCHDFGVFPGVTQAVRWLLADFRRAGVTLAYQEVPS